MNESIFLRCFTYCLTHGESSLNVSYDYYYYNHSYPSSSNINALHFIIPFLIILRKKTQHFLPLAFHSKDNRLALELFPSTFFSFNHDSVRTVCLVFSYKISHLSPIKWKSYCHLIYQIRKLTLGIGKRLGQGDTAHKWQYCHLLQAFWVYHPTATLHVNQLWNLALKPVCCRSERTVGSNSRVLNRPTQLNSFLSWYTFLANAK